jgi:hypothetical protein
MDHDERDPKRAPTLTRRTALKITSGVVLMGTAIGGSLLAAQARAATKRYELRVFKKSERGHELIDTIVMPTQLTPVLNEGRVDAMQFTWFVRTGDTHKRLGSQAAPGREIVARAKRRRKPK